MGDEKRQLESLPPPFALAMVVCDNIHRDPGTGKHFLLGCFSVIQAKEFPAIHPLLALYVSVTNGHGTVPFRVQLIDANEEREPIVMVENDVEFSDPRIVVDIHFTFGDLNFVEPGEYRFQLFASNEFLMERRVLVAQPKQDQIHEEDEDDEQ